MLSCASSSTNADALQCCGRLPLSLFWLTSRICSTSSAANPSNNTHPLLKVQKSRLYDSSHSYTMLSNLTFADLAFSLWNACRLLKSQLCCLSSRLRRSWCHTSSNQTPQAGCLDARHYFHSLLGYWYNSGNLSTWTSGEWL